MFEKMNILDIPTLAYIYSQIELKKEEIVQRKCEYYGNNNGGIHASITRIHIRALLQ